MLWLKEWFDSTGPGAGTSKLSSCRGPPRAYSGCLSGSILASFGARRRCPCRPHAFFRYRRLRHRSRAAAARPDSVLYRAIRVISKPHSCRRFTVAY